MTSVFEKLNKKIHADTAQNLNQNAENKNFIKLNRQQNAADSLRAHESEWWDKYALVEDLYFWRLPDNLQPPSRIRYLEKISKYLANSATIVDYGCGSGWLSRILSKNIKSNFICLDFSDAQIKLAKEASHDFKNLEFNKISSPIDLPKADAYIFHGLLHHLPSNEIDELIFNIKEKAAIGAILIFVEPTCFPGNNPDIKDNILIESIKQLVKSPLTYLIDNNLKECEQILNVRKISEERWWGELPYGPSPMEKPFEEKELPNFLSQYFDLLSDELVQFLPASQALAGELAMIDESFPEFSSTIFNNLQNQMDCLEQILLKYPNPPDCGWYMNLLSFKNN